MIVDINGSSSTLWFLVVDIIPHHLLLLLHHLLLSLIYALDKKETLLLLVQACQASVLNLVAHFILVYGISLIIYCCVSYVFRILWFLVNFLLIFDVNLSFDLETLQLCYCFSLTTCSWFTLLFMNGQLMLVLNDSWW